MYRIREAGFGNSLGPSIGHGLLVHLSKEAQRPASSDQNIKLPCFRNIDLIHFSVFSFLLMALTIVVHEWSNIRLRNGLRDEAPPPKKALLLEF